MIRPTHDVSWTSALSLVDKRGATAAILLLQLHIQLAPTL